MGVMKPPAGCYWYEDRYITGKNGTCTVMYCSKMPLWVVTINPWGDIAYCGEHVEIFITPSRKKRPIGDGIEDTEAELWE